MVMADFGPVMELAEDGLSKLQSVMACLAMAVFYVAILYSPTLILRLPPPSSFKSFMIRRFVCAFFSSLLSIILCASILPIRSWKMSYLSSVYGIRLDHMWQAVVYPLSLTSLMYSGSLVLNVLSLWSSNGISSDGQDHILSNFSDKMLQHISNISAWRNYIVAPLTEELVYRACMVPLLLCAGFGTYNVIFFCPIFFSLAHLNHFLEFYMQHQSLARAFTIVGLQLCYTVVFGSYASFLFIRTGHFIAPLIAHVFCNIMGLPTLYSRESGGLVTVSFLMGMMGFILLLFPLTYPGMYNNRTDSCSCWQRYCIWS
ncbi:CAAX prenyl protease 2-like [Impatiens glandulifera]|uniref:CAAX prenyl protease 2-like n=1 Tax=Impatiens glandulifera TaxID=253017 RepID=UPI001FB10B3F|nr:CAAX prenyl protease 2-like [Impatiens glandulifera]XP_047337053.1 CAAX prenyl protease 2-like [Impatiens glandulifera]XP_047337055.1 CAAX prenyl protease 2-like [Impatiens glandulifera]